MIGTLCWKEYREQRGLWLAILIMAFICVLPLGVLARGGIWHLHEDHELGPVIYFLLVALAVGQGVVCGAQLLAGEKETGTLPFLDTQVPLRTPVWQTKLGMGCLLTVTQALILAGLAVLLGLESWFAFAFFGALAVQALLWGMTGAAYCRSVMLAILAGIGLMIVGLLFTCAGVSFMLSGQKPLQSVIQEMMLQSFRLEMMSVVAGQLCLAGLGSFVSWRIYCETDWERGPTPTQRSPEHGRLMAPFQGLDSIFWLAMRQGRRVIQAGLLISFVTGFFLDNALAVIWPVATLLIGVVCGLCVFAFEQPGEQERFLGAQRFSPGRVWLWKTVFWALAAVAMLTVLIVKSFLPASDGLNYAGSFYVLLYFGLWQRIVFLAMLVIPGFCFGQFFALLTRRIMVAAVLAAAASIIHSAIWLPAVIFGGLSGWQFFAVPLMLLLAGRLSMWSWLSGRIYSRRHILGLIGCGLMSILWPGVNLWQRAIEIPDVGEPFDQAEFDAKLTLAARSEAGPLMRRAAKEMDEHEKRITARLGSPTKFLFPNPIVPAAKPGKNHSFLGMCQEIVENGWPPQDDEISRWFDELFAGGWADQFRKAGQMPLGLLTDPRTLPYARYTPNNPEVGLCGRAAWLFSIRALQLQAKGDDDSALDQLKTALALSRQMGHCSAIRFSGFFAEYDALSCFDRWLVKASGRPGQLRKGLEILRHHESHLADPGDRLKAQYVWMRRQMDVDVSGILLSPPNTFVEKAAVDAAWEVPWERDRQLRLFNVVFEARLHDAESPNSEELPSEGQPQDTFSKMALIEYRLPLPEGPTTTLSAHAWGALLTDSLLTQDTGLRFVRRASNARSLVDIRVRELFLALALYEAENNKPAASLSDLVPRYLPAVPLNPFLNEPFSYKISAGETVKSYSHGQEKSEKLLPGQAVLWSAAEQKFGPSARWYFPVPVWNKK